MDPTQEAAEEMKFPWAPKEPTQVLDWEKVKTVKDLKAVMTFLVKDAKDVRDERPYAKRREEIAHLMVDK